MVPILQQDLPAEHVTLWSRNDPRPLRAVWLENKSKLTLDSGSFSIFESGEFAGEGLLDPIHPGEKRLLSYAVDQAIKVRRGGFADTRTLHHIAMHQPAAHGLGQHHHVGLNSETMCSQKWTGAVQPGLHFVQHEQRAVAPAQGLCGSQIEIGRAHV